MAQGLALSLGLGLSVPPLVLYWHLLWLTPFPPPMVGGPNHYPRLVAIADALGGNRGKRLAPGANPAQLAAEAAALVKGPSYVLMDDSCLTKAGLDEHQRLASAMREIARRFSADAQFATMAGEFDRAAEWGIASVRLGTLMNRGGDVTDTFIGSSSHGVGLVAILRVRGSLSAAGRQSVLAALADWPAGMESDEIILQRSAAYSERAYGWSTRFEHVQSSWVPIDIEPTLMRDMRQRTETLVQLLRADLCIRQFRDEHGHWPPGFDDLVPRYFAAIPIDAYSGDPLQYRVVVDSFVLYSVGPDGQDDGGQLTNAANYRRTGFDYDLDTHTRP